MPKVAVNDTVKVRRIIQEFEDEFTSTSNNLLYCKLCEVVVKHDKRHFVESHRQSGRHISKQKTPLTQQFLSAQTSDFVTDVTRAFLSADIPLKKLKHPAIIALFKSMSKDCPSESACRSQVSELGIKAKNDVKQRIGQSKFFIIADESDINDSKFLNIIVGSVTNPAKTFLLDCIPITGNVNSACVCQNIDDCVRFLSLPRQNFVLFVSDAARYMCLAASFLKNMYPSMLHVTCLAHLLHNCAMSIRTKFTAVDELIAHIKAATVKCGDRRLLFSAIGQPPKPVVTRWATWLKAAMWYAEHLPAIREIVSKFEGTGLLVSRAKEAVANPLLTQQLVNVTKYGSLVELVTKIESSTYTIRDGFSHLKNLNFDDDPCNIKEYINKRLAKNDITVIVNHERNDISPADYALLENCQPTSCAVERSFSMLKHLMRKERNFLIQNVRHYIIMAYNGIESEGW